MTPSDSLTPEQREAKERLIARHAGAAISPQDSAVAYGIDLGFAAGLAFREASPSPTDGDDREWTAVGEQAGAARAGETMWSGPYLKPGERVTVVPKSRLEAVEREGREASPSEATRMLGEFHDALGDARGRGNALLRETLHDEEHAELVEAIREGDRAHIARELADVVYVAFGTAHAYNIDLDAALAEIHRAAMSKLDPATMVVRDDGKIMKPPGFVPPNMAAALAAASPSTKDTA